MYSVTMILEQSATAIYMQLPWQHVSTSRVYTDGDSKEGELYMWFSAGRISSFIQSSNRICVSIDGASHDFEIKTWVVTEWVLRGLKIKIRLISMVPWLY